MATVSLQTVFDEARRALEAGAADKAIGIAQHILVHFPRMIEGYRLLGEAHLNASQPEQAAAAFERVLQADPENVAAYYGLGLARQNLDQRAAAITAFERALEIQPNLADLRSQLMRLYSETPGSAGQFRLSRAGLGRLYARGGMFGQAIDEYRAVLDSDSSRDDVKSALAEALWRDGQEDEAMEFCRDVLERQPDLLKPTVLLGYLLFATGQPEGETLWRRAAEQDAPITLARSLFDILPPIRLEEPVLPEFNEAEWRAKEARRSAEQPVQAAAPAFAATSEDDFFADSWLSSAGSTSTPSSNTRIYDDLGAVTAAGAASSAADDDDDLLASLLGFGGSEPTTTPATPTNDRDQIQPFGFDWDDDPPTTAQPLLESLPSSLDDIGVHDSELPRGNNADVGGVQPFSFDDWGLDEDLGSAKNSTPASSADADLDFPDISAFSLDDDTADTSTNVQPFSLEAENTGGVQPFSLDEDLGDFGGIAPFSFEDEARTPSTGNAPAPTESGLGSVQPFSLDDWGLDDAAGGNLKPLSTDELTSSDDDFGTFKPFSLDELSLDTLEDEAGSSLSGPQIGSEDQESEEPNGFSWQEPSWRTQNTQSKPPESLEGDSIFAKLMRNRPAEPAVPEVPQPAQASAQTDADDELNFFSIDDEPLRLDEAEDQEGWFSEQQPSATELVEPFQGFATGEPAPTAEQPSESTAQPVHELPTEAGSFFSLEDLESDQGFSWETSPATQQPDQTTPAEAGGFFSLEDLESEQGFSWETGAANQPAETPAEQEPQPFSLSDLGLSDDELDALNIPAESSTESDADQESDALPFSLSDLGLSDDELDALSLDTNATAEESALPTLPEDMRSDLAETSQPAEVTEGEPDLTPFSLADFGLNDDELSFFEQTQAGHAGGETETSTPVSQPASSEGEPDMTPFSLSDLGLDDDELSFFEQTQAEQGGGETAASSPVESAETTESEADMTPFSLADLGLNDDELAFLEQAQAGQELDTASQQTSEDVNLLFADFDLPAAEEPQPETPMSPFAEQASQPLETPVETNIFGEPLTTDVDEPSFEVAPATPSAEDQPDLTPFSLADFGLNDDELSFFEQTQAGHAGGETETSTPVSQPASSEGEPDMTPFSLADLGLNEDELSFFEQAQAEQGGAGATALDEPAQTTESEPDMTPFSLADLGLNEDELSFFEQTQAEQSVAEQPEVQSPVEDAGQPQESFESPFSLADLENDSPFANLDQAPEPVTDQSASVFDNAAQADEPLPMELPEGAQPVASAAEAEAVQPAPAQPVTSTAAFSAGGGDLSAFHSMLEADPENDAMRLAVARMSQQTNDIGQAVEQYKQLIKRGSLLDEVVVDLQDSIADSDDPQMLRRLHRLLGDAYMKQNRFREAMDEYSWTLARSR